MIYVLKVYCYYFRICVFVIWTPPFIGDRLKHQEVDKCIWEPSDNREFIIVVDIIGHYIPCLLVVVAYIKVYTVMKKRSKTVSHNGGGGGKPTTITVKGPHLMVDPGFREGSSVGASVSFITSTMAPASPSVTASTSSNSSNTTKKTRASSKEHRIFRTLTYVIVSYLICWFPFYVAWDIYAWLPSLVPDWLYTFFFWMTYINSTLNPVLYAYTNKDFRKAFKVVMKCSCKRLNRV